MEKGAKKNGKNVIHLYTNSWPPEVYNIMLEAKYTMETQQKRQATVTPPRIWEDQISED